LLESAWHLFVAAADGTRVIQRRFTGLFSKGGWHLFELVIVPMN